MTTTEGRPLHDLLDAETLTVLVRSLRWLAYRAGVPGSVTRQVTSAILSTPVPITPLLDEDGVRVGTLVEADTSRLVAIARDALLQHLSAAGYPTDPAQW